MDDKMIQIKKQILSELGYLSYMEKKKIRDDHDQVFIEKEIKAIQKRKKNQFVGIAFLSVAFISGILSILYDAKPIISLRNIIGVISFTIMVFLNVFLYSSQLLENTKRETLYRILSVFNKEKTKTV
ncbi:MAG: hypothetical protein HYZ10_16045 [Ignavibacteriales bacterium]|nr:hypothetical protein [Ignavibacteriales bacterium]